MLVSLTSILFLLIGLALGAAGIYLATLGGSWAFIAIAVGFLLTGFFLLKRSSLALWIYALVILGALCWAVYEVGFDWWRLGSTGGIIVLLGLWLLTPWVRKPLNGGGLPLTIATLAALVVAGYSMTQDPTSINGNLPTEKVAATPDLGGNVPDGEWHQYGRTPYGQRYSPLAQITPENVSKLQVAWHTRPAMSSSRKMWVKPPIR